jgi:isoamylase
VLRLNRFLTGVYNEELGVKDLTWLQCSGAEMTQEKWKDPHLHCIGVIFDGRAQTTGLREKGSDATVLLLFNAHHEKIGFTMPATIEGDEWRLLLDTSKNLRTARKVLRPGETRLMADHSMVAYVMQRAKEEEST